MKNLNFSIEINAPKEKVWKTMLDDATYRQWTEVFSPGSYYTGSWEKGSEIIFLGVDEKGNKSGMIGKVNDNRPNEFISLGFLGEVANGVEDRTSDKVKTYADGHENYSFSEKDGVTKLEIDTTSTDEFSQMMEDMWLKGLKKLKEMCENGARENVTVEVIVNAPMEKAWETWTEPKHIMQWNHASDDWETTASQNDLQVGGKFSSTMGAKDKSVSFDFGGTYSAVKKHELIEYDMGDGRHVKVVFTQLPEGVKVTETFDIENTNSKEMQRGGWQAIMDNYKKHTEANK